MEEWWSEMTTRYVTLTLHGGVVVVSGSDEGGACAVQWSGVEWTE